MIKMVVSSFYNTLINEEEAVPTSTMLEIDRIRQKGILFVIATNGLYKEIIDYNKDFPFVDYIISLNGSCLYDAKKEKEIYKKKISIATRKKISTLVEDKGIFYYTEEKVYHHFSEIEDKNIFKIELDIPKQDEKVIQEIKKMKVNYSILRKNNKEYLEIISPQVNMFTGADQIALKHNISLKEILVIAGNESDYSLVSNIKNSYIVENSDKSLRKSTKKKTSANTKNGVENVIKKVQ